MDRYSLGKRKLLGEGTYGEVFLSRERSSERVVAVKRAKAEVCPEEGIPVSVIREVGMLKWMNEESEHIVRLEDHFFDEDHSVLLHIMKELLTGVEKLHVNCIVHRDLKPANILVSTAPNEKPTVRIADMGLARNLTVPVSTYTHEVMSLWYMAPEILLGGQYTYQIDMWSMGCIFAELFLGKPLLRGECYFTQLLAIFQMLGSPNEEIWPGVTELPSWMNFPEFEPGELNTTMEECMRGDQDALDLLMKMLHCDPSQRIHASDALKHPYFAGSTRIGGEGSAATGSGATSGT
ncbi:hypothetical protein BSKO_05918 [Bryopsis sp. KO-2023]|nr:hypothetical protein BSKO_05918 [Bryopsis sp. KO-2023]